MNLRLLFVATLALSIPAAAQPVYQPYIPKDWKFSEADAGKWIERLKKLCPPRGWTVSASGNKIELFQVIPPLGQQNAAKTAPAPAPAEVFGYRLTLWFGPKINLDTYEKLAAENSIVREEDLKLQAKYEVAGKLGVNLLFESDEKVLERVREYHKDSKTLNYHSLPDFYTPDASILLTQSRRPSRASMSTTDLEWDG